MRLFIIALTDFWKCTCFLMIVSQGRLILCFMTLFLTLFIFCICVCFYLFYTYLNVTAIFLLTSFQRLVIWSNGAIQMQLLLSCYNISSQVLIVPPPLVCREDDDDDDAIPVNQPAISAFFQSNVRPQITKKHPYFQDRSLTQVSTLWLSHASHMPTIIWTEFFSLTISGCSLRGWFAKLKKSDISLEVGGRVQVSLENRPQIVYTSTDIWWGGIPRVFFCTIRY